MSFWTPVDVSLWVSKNARRKRDLRIRLEIAPRRASAASTLVTQRRFEHVDRQAEGSRAIAMRRWPKTPTGAASSVLPGRKGRSSTAASEPARSRAAEQDDLVRAYRRVALIPSRDALQQRRELRPAVIDHAASAMSVHHRAASTLRGRG